MGNATVLFQTVFFKVYPAYASIKLCKFICFGESWFSLVWFGLVRFDLVHGPATIVGLGRGGGEERAMMVRAALQSGPALPWATTASCGGSVRFVFLAYLFLYLYYCCYFYLYLYLYLSSVTNGTRKDIVKTSYPIISRYILGRG